MIRYKKLGYVELNVSDLESSRRFHQDVFGLEHVGRRSDGAEVFHCDDEDSRLAILHQRQQADLKSVGVGGMLKDDAQCENVDFRLRDANVGYEELASAECALRRTPSSRILMQRSNSSRRQGPAQQAFRDFPHKEPAPRTRRVLDPAQEKESIAGFREVLKFRESGSLGEATTFMRPFLIHSITEVVLARAQPEYFDEWGSVRDAHMAQTAEIEVAKILARP